MEESGERKVNVTKLGEFKLNDFNVLVVNKTDYSGEDKVDFRVWSNSYKYKGPTKQGFTLPIAMFNEFVDSLNAMRSKLGPQKAAEEPEPAKKKTKKGK